MKILLIGNIGSGKTTIAKELIKKLKIPFYEIDILRKKHSDGTIPGEYLALHHFMKACNSKEKCVLEFSGIGCHKYSVKRALEESKESVLAIAVLSDENVNKERIKNKKWDTPHPWVLDLDNAMIKIEQELYDDLIKEFWVNERLNHFVITIKNLENSKIEELVDEIIIKMKELEIGS